MIKYILLMTLSITAFSDRILDHDLKKLDTQYDLARTKATVKCLKTLEAEMKIANKKLNLVKVNEIQKAIKKIRSSFKTKKMIADAKAAEEKEKNAVKETEAEKVEMVKLKDNEISGRDLMADVWYVLKKKNRRTRSNFKLDISFKLSSKDKTFIINNTGDSHIGTYDKQGTLELSMLPNRTKYPTHVAVILNLVNKTAVVNVVINGSTRSSHEGGYWEWKKMR